MGRGKRMQGSLKKHVLVNSMIFMIPVISIIVVLLCNNYRFKEWKCMESEYLLLQQYEQKVEGLLERFSITANQITEDSKISPYKWKQGNYDTRLAMEQLGLYWSGNSEFYEMVICIDETDKVYHMSGISDFKVYINRFFSVKNEANVKIIYDLLYGKQRYGFMTYDQFERQGDYKMTLITYPIGYKRPYGAYGTLVGILDNDFFSENLIESYLSSDTAIFDSSGKVFFTTLNNWENVWPEVEKIMIGDEASKYQMVDAGKQEYAMILSTSKSTGLFYLRLIEMETLAEMVWKEMLPMIVTFLVLGVLTVVVFAWIIAIYNYMPIRNLYHLFSRDSNVKEKVDELSFVKKYVFDLIESNHSMKQKMQEKDYYRMKEMLVDRLYEDGYSKEEDEELLGLLGMELEKYEFTIIMLQQRHGTVEYDEVVLHSSLLDMQEEDTIYLTEESNKSFVFLHYAVEGTDSALDKGRRMVEMLYAEGLMFRVGVGRCRTSLSDIRESMLESILALDLAPEQSVAIFEQLAVVYPQNNYVLPGKEELLLQIYIQKGNHKGILEQLDILETFLKQQCRYLQRQELRFVMYRLIYYLRELPKVSEEKLSSTVKELMEHTDIQTFFSCYCRFVEEVIAEETTDSNDSKDERIQEMLKHVDENYTNPEMGLSYMAQHFGLRESYFSTYFKEKAGVTFISYLSEKRLEEGSRLLRETKDSIQDIVNAIGYTDTTSFSRKFAKRYGMKPGEYRVAFQNEEL